MSQNKHYKKSKRARKSKLKGIIVIVLIVICIKILCSNKVNLIDTVSVSTEDGETKIETFFSNIELNMVASISKYIVYGTHLNLEGTINISSTEEVSIENVQVIIKDYDGNETQIDTEYEEVNQEILFTTLGKINNGLNLEKLTSENYFFLLKISFSDSSTKYYSLSNGTEYTDDIEYYTLTRNSSNNKVTIFWSTYNEISYFALTNAEVDNLPDDVYDIVIDAGHGGTDSGAVSTDGKYYESELVLEYALELAELLENDGLKVLLTRDGTEDENVNMAYTMYDEDGRVNVANASGAKILISLHMNSNEDFVYIGGVEVYAPNDCDLTFAKLLADNIVEYANTTYSPLESYKQYAGVYVHTFTESEIKDFAKSARTGGYTPYTITTSTPYFYMIRETGGIATNAFVDGRNTNYGTNLYYNSNVGIESYLIELGYISVQSDLKKLLNNQSLYVEAIRDSIITFYDL